MKRFYTKAIAILFAVLMLTSFAACGKQENPEDVVEPYLESDARTQLIVGLDDTFAPMGFRDEDNNLVGFDIDLATAVCEYLGWEVKFQPIDWDSKELELNSGKIDCIWNGMSITPERQASMSLSKAYLNNKLVIMCNEGVEITAKEDLANYKIGTQAESSALETMKADPIWDSIEKNVTEYRNYDEVIMDMQSGRIDVMIVDEVLGEYKNNQLQTKFTVAPVDFGDDLYAIGFRKEDLELTKQVEDAIDALIASGKAAEISEKWFGKNIVIG